jgi:hypothetical protein
LVTFEFYFQQNIIATFSTRNISIIMRSVIGALAFAAGVCAQSTTYTDANTGIDFQQYVDTAGVSFGIAIPETPASDFIGQMVRKLVIKPIVLY